MNIQNIPIEKLIISTLNVRQLNEDDKNNINLERLENDIKVNGLLNPLSVIYNDKTDIYEILAGCRRFHVLNKIKYTHIKCNIMTNLKTDVDKIIVSFAENIQRKDMKLSEKILTIKNLQRLYQEQFSRKFPEKNERDIKKEIKEEISKNTNYNKTSIGQYLKISHLPNFIIDKLDKKGNERISLEFAVCLDKLNIYDEQELVEIVEFFHDVKSSDRIKIMKKIRDECKYVNIDFTKYIINISKIKTIYFEDLEKEVNEKIRNEQLLQEVLKQKNPKIYIDNDKSNTKIKKILSVDEYNDKINDIIKSNGGDVYVKGTKIRKPELQSLFRKQIIYRYNNRCIISNMYKSVCEAAHIRPFSETLNFEVDNGILLNDILHKLFDKYYWSINPTTLCVELFIDDTNGTFDILKPYENKYIECFKNYPKSIENLGFHYNKCKIINN